MTHFVPGYDAAIWGGAPISETPNPVAGALDNQNDVHFGRNFDVVIAGLPAKPGHIKLTDGQWATIGPRIYDVASRGGTVAEVLWFKWKMKPTSNSVSGFLTFFDDIHRGYGLVDRNTYGAGATFAGGGTLEGNEKYLGGNKQVTLSENRQHLHYKATVKVQFLNGHQLGERWSKVALEWARENGRVHFHLDGMGDLQQITNKTANASHNVTSRELRYVFRNWRRNDKPFKGKVSFYNGYTNAAKTIPRAVACPWDPVMDILGWN